MWSISLVMLSCRVLVKADAWIFLTAAVSIVVGLSSSRNEYPRNRTWWAKQANQHHTTPYFATDSNILIKNQIHIVVQKLFS